MMFDLMPFEHRTRNLSNLFDAFDKTFFNDFSSSFAEIRADILDQGDQYLLQAELPGFSREEIKIDLNGDTLTVSAEHKAETEKTDKDGYIRRERRYGSFARSFDVSGINVDAIGADYKNGILELTLPKKVPDKPQTRRIELQ